MVILRRLGLYILLVAAAIDMSGGFAVAEPAATPPVPPPNVQPIGRSYYVEGGVVVLLMAAAGFAVCRSSRR